MKKVKSIEEFGLLIKDKSKTIENEGSKQKSGFLSMLLGTLGATLLENLLAGKYLIRTGERTIIARRDF